MAIKLLTTLVPPLSYPRVIASLHVSSPVVSSFDLALSKKLYQGSLFAIHFRFKTDAAVMANGGIKMRFNNGTTISRWRSIYRGETQDGTAVFGDYHANATFCTLLPLNNTTLDVVAVGSLLIGNNFEATYTGDCTLDSDTTLEFTRLKLAGGFKYTLSSIASIQIFHDQEPGWLSDVYIDVVDLSGLPA